MGTSLVQCPIVFCHANASVVISLHHFGASSFLWTVVDYDGEFCSHVH